MNLDKLTVLCGLSAAVAFVILIIRRRKKLGLRDLGAVATAFFSASNIPAAVWLCWYAFDPDLPTVVTKLHGFEKHIAFAGCALLLVSVSSLWALARGYASRVRAPRERSRAPQSLPQR